jgi:hypothetical protein
VSDLSPSPLLLASAYGLVCCRSILPDGLSCMLYHCHELVHLCVAQHKCMTVERGEVGPSLDDCRIHSPHKSVHGVHSPQVCVLAFDIIIVLIYSIVFLDILNGGFFKSKEKFCPPNGHGVVFANKF